jgi:hypothetical protein
VLNINIIHEDTGKHTSESGIITSYRAYTYRPAGYYRKTGNTAINDSFVPGFRVVMKPSNAYSSAAPVVSHYGFF